MIANRLKTSLIIVVLFGAIHAVMGCGGSMTLLANLKGAASTPLHDLGATPAAMISPSPDSASTPIPAVEGPWVIGYSSLEVPIHAYRIGSGPRARLIVGGIHGGYEGNTIELVQKFVDVLIENPESVPSQLTLYLIPCANPDGAAAGTDRIHGRMNGNLVDLNRNWDYRWQPISNHGPWTVSGGSAPFSEPETAALRDFILEREIEAAIFYHSAWGAVFPGSGQSASQAEALALLVVEHTGYLYAPTDIDWQPPTGNATDWLTTNGIPSIDIELTNHVDIDWDINWEVLQVFLGWDIPNEGPES
ncbi:MAG TPA: hypothetical protein G4O08_00805 [Anaerolineae bacterium]|nr:hypothetical protein [Anaerolineae bacterium]